MNKYYYVINKGEALKIVNYAIKYFGLPKIKSRLNIYGILNDNEISVRFQDGKVQVKYSEGNSFNVENKSLKYFIRVLSSLGLEKVSIGEVVVNDFYKDGVSLSYIKDSFLGDFIELSADDDKISHAINNFSFIKFISRKELLKNSVSNFDDFLFDDAGFVNKKIKHFSDRNGFDLFSDSGTYESRLEAVSNNYSALESFL